jgi:hypothetical protein
MRNHLPVIRRVFNQTDAEEIRRLVSSTHVYYQLVGGLGNQLFGLSHIHLICKHFGWKAVIDISRVEHNQRTEIPYSLQLLQNLDWATVIASDTDILSDLKSSAVNLDFLYPSNSHTRSFIGWLPSLSMVTESNLIQKGLFADSTMLPKLKSTIGIHIRLGDYLLQENFGVLTPKYFKQSYSFAKKLYPDAQIIVFSDDISLARIRLKSIDQDFQYFESLNVLETLREMSRVDFLIGANSTFSFWARYIGDLSCTSPSPWYLVSPEWDINLRNEQTIVIKQFRIERLALFRYQFSMRFKHRFAWLSRDKSL